MNFPPPAYFTLFADLSTENQLNIIFVCMVAYGEYLPIINLRSASALLLQQPPASAIVFSSRAFPVAAPSAEFSEHSHSLS